MGRMDGKVAVIFGTGPNIGGTIAHFMAREGAKVVVNDVVPSAAEETLEFLTSRGYEAIAVPGDAREEPDVKHVFDEAVKRFGYVTTCVNSAVQMYRSPVTEIEVDKWNWQMASIQTAGMLTTKHAARAMLAQNIRGCIILMLSTAAHWGEANHAAYCTAKAGLMNFSRAAAMDLAYAGIRVNTVTPYAMEHNLWSMMRDEITVDAGTPERTRYSYSRDDILKVVPLARFPRASDIAWTTLFLASDEASFLTGVDIPVDGGTSVKYPSWRPGDYTGISIQEYVKDLNVTRFGEPIANFEDYVRETKGSSMSSTVVEWSDKNDPAP